MKKTFVSRAQNVLFCIAGILLAALLLQLWVLPNVEVQRSRETRSEPLVIENVAVTEVESPDAPIGFAYQYAFTLDAELGYGTMLGFCTSHRWVDVYLDGEHVYSLRPAQEEPVITGVGSSWTMIPLERADEGKAVLVVAAPTFKSHTSSKEEFLLGPGTTIYMEALRQSFPELLLGLIVILAGLLLLCMAVYFTAKRIRGADLYALAALAISIGLWRMTDASFSPLLMQDRPTFLYDVSVTMLMICMVPMVKASIKPVNPKGVFLVDGYCICVTLSCIVQLLIQLMGVLDLREMLTVTHGTILVGSLMILVNSVYEWIKYPRKTKAGAFRNSTWMICAGALADLTTYFARNTASGLLFTLTAILCYTVKEGVRMFWGYVHQRQMIEERETQLTLSRITTMASQIRSHFVFNILNAISGMCKYDPEKADETIVRFARYLRSNIDIMEDDRAILFSAELQRLEDYVLLEQVRFGDKIEFVTDIEEVNFEIPPLILQPIIENAIKHGLTKKMEGGTILLRTRAEGNAIRITVEDDGVGFETQELQKNGSVGLRNIRFRLEHLVHGTMEIESQVGRGTKVTITIPRKDEPACA